MTKEHSLPVRIAIHQRIGEWLGVDAAIWWYQHLNNRDAETAQMFEYISLDEITHVAFGNKWLRYLVKSDEEVLKVHEYANRVRTEAGASVNASFPYPINHSACKASCFTESEIIYLEAERKST